MPYCRPPGLPDFFESFSDIFSICTFIHAEPVAFGILNTAGRIILIHKNSDAFHFRIRTGNTVQCLHDLSQIHHSEHEHAAHKDRKHTAYRPDHAVPGTGKQDRNNQHQHNNACCDPHIFPRQKAAGDQHDHEYSGDHCLDCGEDPSYDFLHYFSFNRSWLRQELLTTTVESY